MNRLYKITLLITMAVVTWKVCKIESNTRKNYLASVSSSLTARPLAKSIASRY